jgi:hypothetical protein
MTVTLEDRVRRLEEMDIEHSARANGFGLLLGAVALALRDHTTTDPTVLTGEIAATVKNALGSFRPAEPRMELVLDRTIVAVEGMLQTLTTIVHKQT